MKGFLNMKKLRPLAFTMATLLFLSGCAHRESGNSDGAGVALPELPSAPPEQILGDRNANEVRETTLYCVAGGNLELTAITRTMHSASGRAYLEEVLKELLLAASTPISAGLGQVQLLGVEYGGGVVTVRLNLDAAANRAEQDYLLLCASIANTLLPLEGVDCVNVLTDSRSASIAGLPTGAYVQNFSSVAAAYAQIQAESERFSDPLTDSTITRSALLYFPAHGGRHLLSEARELNFASEDYASELISALRSGSQARDCCFSALPETEELLAAAPEISVSDAGERVLELQLHSTAPNYLAMAGVDPWQLYGSLTLTFCSFLPELDAVRISIGSIYVTECTLPDGSRCAFESGLMRRRHFASLIGGSALLCFADENGKLVQAECAMSQAAALSPVKILDCMIEADGAAPFGLRSVFPEGAAREDILGVRIENRTATVNLSGRLYSLCQSMDAAQERALIYGMVNALAELEDVGAVRFLVEGVSVDSLAQEICLGAALMPDPGLFSLKTPEDDADVEAANADSRL